MPGGSTPKGRHRREALVAAGAALAAEEGFAAVTHRAVAARSGLALAATTYYFADRADLVRAALEKVAAAEVERARNGADAQGSLAEVLVEVAVGGDRLGDARRLAALYERVLEAVRVPSLGEAVARWQEQLLGVVAEVLERHGSALPPRAALALVDGCALQALNDGRPDREHLVRLVSAALPPTDRPRSR